MSQEEPWRGFHISIVGNVGTGKSTLAKLIQRRWSCKLYLEDPDDYLFLRLFFHAPHEWGFANQLQFVITKFAQQGQIRHHNQCAVQEMSAHATHFIWTRASYEIGHISRAEMEAIGQIYDLLATTPISLPNLTIVLLASLETLEERIRRRGRDYEGLDPTFLHLLEVVDRFTMQFTYQVPGHLILVDTEQVDFTAPSASEEDLLDDILRHVPGP